MEVWLESGSKVPGVDRVVDEDLIIDGNAIYIEGKQVVGVQMSVIHPDKQLRGRWQEVYLGFYSTLESGK